MMMKITLMPNGHHANSRRRRRPTPACQASSSSSSSRHLLVLTCVLLVGLRHHHGTHALNLRLLRYARPTSSTSSSSLATKTRLTDKVSERRKLPLDSLPLPISATTTTTTTKPKPTQEKQRLIDESVSSRLFRKPAFIEATETATPAVEATAPETRRKWRRRRKKDRPIVTSVDDLRTRILDDPRAELRDVRVQLDAGAYTVPQVLTHDVLELLGDRFRAQSTPGRRGDDDEYHLSLAIEGGGMRGAVSAGMAAAIAGLGLVDAFDSIYGSSAGSVIGAYMVSRQMCMDVYVDILTAAKKQFVCTKRLVGSLAATGMDLVLPESIKRWSSTAASISRNETTAGMNISFVLDGVMDHRIGIRPLDLEQFLENNQRQPLKIASSYVKNGKLGTQAFGADDFDRVQRGTSSDADGGDADSPPATQRLGLYTCLEASMTVPGATGPPVPIVYNCDSNSTTAAATNSSSSIPHFDAFCFEPLPYRSAVADGATHVLCLCSRPEGFQPKCTPGVYELGVAPLYFSAHGEPEVARFFERGGQQYIYAEDLLTLEQGKQQGIFKQGPIAIPPPKVLYGVDHDSKEELQEMTRAKDREQWNKAHLFPLKVPMGTPELPTLEQDRVAVLEAVRGGFAAAFDLLAPVVGLEIHLQGKDVARMVFPDSAGLADEILLEEQLRVKGDSIPEVAPEPEGRRRKLVRLLGRFRAIRLRRRSQLRDTSSTGIWRRLRKGSDSDSGEDRATNPAPIFSTTPDLLDPQLLLEVLPGFRAGKMSHLASALYQNRTM